MTTKIFCVKCDWSVIEVSSKSLNGKHSKCPECGGHTDAIPDVVKKP